MNKTYNKRAYARPEIEVVPCAISSIMAATVRADGFGWNYENRDLGNGWENGRPEVVSPFSAFRFKSVWDATAKELQDGELITVSID